MSIHLEHGYRLPTMTLRDFNTLVLTYRESVHAWARTAYQRQAADLAYRLADTAVTASSWATYLDYVQNEYVSPPDSTQLSRMTLRDLVQAIITDHQHAIHRDARRDPAYDWSCKLSALPVSRMGLYVLLWAEPRIYHTLWQALPGVTAYGYQNATDDRPDGVSAAQWQRRRARWNAVLNGDSPNQRGLTVVIYDPILDWENRFWTVDPANRPDCHVYRYTFHYAGSNIIYHISE